MFQSLRFGLRVMRKSPGFTVIAILTLALGVGANTAIFSVVDALLLRPLPLHDPSRLVVVTAADPGRPGTAAPYSLIAYEALRDHNRSFAGIAAFTTEGLTLTGTGDPEQLSAARVAPEFFDVLESSPVKGRTFQRAEGEPGGNPVAVISSALWHRRFGSDPNIEGKPITLSQESYSVVGVMPPDYPFPIAGVDVWITRMVNYSGLAPEQIRNGAGFVTAIARLKKGVTVSEADAEVAVLNKQYRQEHPGNPDADPRGRLVVDPLQESLVNNIRPTLVMMTAAVGLVLLIACANVASLMLARATGRAREIVIRASLGAGRGTLIRQLLAESMLLSLLGGALGVMVASWGVALLVPAAGETLPGFQPIQVDLRVLAFTLSVSLLAGILFGLAPALEVSRPNLMAVLRESGWGTTGGAGRQATRSALVAGQMALSIVLLIGAGLLVESFRQLQNVRPGFDATHTLTMRFSLPAAKYPDDARRARFVHDLTELVERLPGVTSTTASLGLPLVQNVMAPYLPAGQADLPIAQRPLATWNAITPNYFKTLGIPLVRGRDFTWEDDDKAPRRVMVSQTLARQWWPNEDPIGKHLIYARRQFDAEIIGVAGDVKSRGLDSAPAAVFYTPYPQFAWSNLSLSVRTKGDPLELSRGVRAQILARDRDLPVVGVQSLEQLVDNTLSQRKQTMFLIAGFAVAALLLAVVGLYGVMAYSVAQRTTEIGIRQAIGAQRGDILRLIVRQAVRLSLAGIAIGVVAAMAATRLLTGMLFQVSATDPLTYGGISILFLLVALAASLLPAWRAMRVDAIDALRHR
jgi:putative ABC transport system permease protein